MRRKDILYQIVPKTASILYIILFVYAAISKLINYDQFKIQLGQSPIITAYADWAAWGVPVLELLIAGLFLVQKYIIYAFYASYALMAMFTTYIIIILNFSDFIPCSCGGVLQDLGWKEHILFNLAFVLLSILAIYALGQTTEHNKNPLQ